MGWPGAFANDVEALGELRRFYDFIPMNNRAGVPVKENCTDSRERTVPLLDNIVPDDPNVPYDMKTVVQGIVDDGDFFEIMKDYAKNIVVGFARMEGKLLELSVINQTHWPDVLISIQVPKARDLSVFAMHSTSQS